MGLLSSYPYLGSCLLMLVVSAFAAGVCLREQRAAMLLSSALTIPVGMFAFLYVPDYWDPAQVFRWHAGPEDTLFGLANGATVWVLATRGPGQRMDVCWHPIRMLWRYLPVLVGGLLLYPCFSALGMRPMDAALLGIAMVACVLLSRRRELWGMAVFSGSSFGLLYAAVMLASVGLWPHFGDQWNHDRLWGVAIGGVPLEEFAWALAFGVTWPLVVAHVLGARPATGREPASGSCETSTTRVSAGAPDS
jgi:hypothetical protein